MGRRCSLPEASDQKGLQPSGRINDFNGLERERVGCQVGSLRDLAEMEAEEKRRSVIAADEIEAAWIAVLALLRTRLLALPDRLAPQEALPDPVHKFTVSRSGRDSLCQKVATPGPTLSRPPMGTIVPVVIGGGLERSCPAQPLPRHDPVIKEGGLT